MLIRKLFKFEGAHIVRGCSTRRCSMSIHGHSYKVEVLVSAEALDRGQMVFDFSLLKSAVGALIDGFDHAVAFWDHDEPAYINACKIFSERWVSLPVSPSAEQFSRVFFCLIDDALKRAPMVNGEVGVTLHSVIVHETDTGYAQCFRADAYSSAMGDIALDAIVYSPAVQRDWVPDQT